MLRQEELAFIKAISTLRLSPAILKELKMAMSRRKKKPAVPVGIHSTISASGAQSPQRLLASKRKANELASHQAPSTWRWVRASAREIIGSHGRTRCILQPAPRVPRGRGDVRGCLGWVRRPSSAKWVAQAHSYGFRPIWIRCLVRDSQ